MSAREEEQRLELERACSEALRDLEARRAEVEERVDQLLEFESQLRTYLTSYFSGQLEMLHRSPVVTLMATADAEEAQAG
jgi:RNase P/RNase MRP subunit p30